MGRGTGPPAGRRFGAVADRWEAVTEQGVSEGTLRAYRNAGAHVRRWMGAIDVGAVAAGHLAEMEADLVRAGLAPLYARNARTFAVMVLGHAAELGLIDTVPRGSRRRLHRVRPRQRRRYLERAELAAALAIPGRLRDAFRLAAVTGLRAGELLALEREDLDHENLVLRVRRGLNHWGGPGPLKTPAARRDVDLPREALDLIPSAPGRLWPVSYSTALDHWHSAIEAVGLDTCGLHALRHTNASVRIALGQDLVYIADQLGHSSPEVTLRSYGHLIERERRDASALMTLVAG